jgi:hypothetical protein
MERGLQFKMLFEGSPVYGKYEVRGAFLNISFE